MPAGVTRRDAGLRGPYAMPPACRALYDGNMAIGDLETIIQPRWQLARRIARLAPLNATELVDRREYMARFYSADFSMTRVRGYNCSDVSPGEVTFDYVNVYKGGNNFIDSRAIKHTICGDTCHG